MATGGFQDVNMADLEVEKTHYERDLAKKRVVLKVVRILDYPGIAEHSTVIHPKHHGKNFTYPAFVSNHPNPDCVLLAAGKNSKDFEKKYYSDEFSGTNIPDSSCAQALLFEDVIPLWCIQNDGRSRGPPGTSLHGLPLYEEVLHMDTAEYAMSQEDLKHLLYHLKFHILLNDPPCPSVNPYNYTPLSEKDANKTLALATLFPPPILKCYEHPLIWSHQACKVIVKTLDCIQGEFFNQSSCLDVDRQGCNRSQGCKYRGELMKAYVDFYSAFKLCQLDSQTMLFLELQ